MNLSLTNMWVTDEDLRILLAIWRFLLWVGTQWFWDRPALKSWLLGLCQKLLVLFFRSNSAVCASLDSNPRVSAICGPFLPRRALFEQEESSSPFCRWFVVTVFLWSLCSTVALEPNLEAKKKTCQLLGFVSIFYLLFFPTTIRSLGLHTRRKLVCFRGSFLHQKGFFEGHFLDIYWFCPSALDPWLSKFAVRREEQNLGAMSSTTEVCLPSGRLLLLSIHCRSLTSLCLQFGGKNRSSGAPRFHLRSAAGALWAPTTFGFAASFSITFSLVDRCLSHTELVKLAIIRV
jgi:hypothetical protein